MTAPKFTNTAINLSRVFYIVGGIIGLGVAAISFISGARWFGIFIGAGSVASLLWGLLGAGHSVARSIQEDFKHFDE